MKRIENIALIGAGNVATHLAQAMHDAGVNIKGIWSRHVERANTLCEKGNWPVLTAFDDINAAEIDLAIVCVVDDAIQSVIEQIDSSIPVAYTSGSVRLDQLNKRGAIGVFYPLQTFSKDRQIDLSHVPFLIESENSDFAELLYNLAAQLSQKVIFADSKDRYQLHIAAVMVNNFSNHLFDLADQHVQKQGLDFSLLLPLIEETVSKLKTLSPRQAQTGPAKRGDKQVIQQHINSLDGTTKDIYELLSQSIIKQFTSTQ